MRTRGRRQSRRSPRPTTQTRRRVAIDVLVASGEGVDVVRRNFLGGARGAVVLDGPHLARVLDGGLTAEGVPWVARDESPMRSLVSVLTEHRSLATAYAVDIALAACDALAEAHANDIVHGNFGAKSIHLEWGSDGPAGIKVIDIARPPPSRVFRFEASLVRAPEQLEVTASVDERVECRLGSASPLDDARGCRPSWRLAIGRGTSPSRSTSRTCLAVCRRARVTSISRSCDLEEPCAQAAHLELLGCAHERRFERKTRDGGDVRWSMTLIPAGPSDPHSR